MPVYTATDSALSVVDDAYTADARSLMESWEDGTRARWADIPSSGDEPEVNTDHSHGAGDFALELPGFNQTYTSPGMDDPTLPVYPERGSPESTFEYWFYLPSDGMADGTQYWFSFGHQQNRRDITTTDDVENYYRVEVILPDGFRIRKNQNGSSFDPYAGGAGESFGDFTWSQGWNNVRVGWFDTSPNIVARAYHEDSGTGNISEYGYPNRLEAVEDTWSTGGIGTRVSAGGHMWIDDMAILYGEEL